MNHEAWTPIEAFRISFHGMETGTTIKNLNAQVEDERSGLFGRVEGAAVIENINIENATVAGKKAGAFFGYVASGVTVRNCKLTGTVVVELSRTGQGTDGVGVICGASQFGFKVENVVVDADVTLNLGGLKAGDTTNCKHVNDEQYLLGFVVDDTIVSVEGIQVNGEITVNN